MCIRDRYSVIDADEEYYYYRVYERGAIETEKKTKDINEVLFWAFDSIIFSIASNYELHHRILGQDFRRLLFQKELELMQYLDDNLRSLLQNELNKILKRAPFNDIEQKKWNLVHEYPKVCKALQQASRKHHFLSLGAKFKIWSVLLKNRITSPSHLTCLLYTSKFVFSLYL